MKEFFKIAMYLWVVIGCFVYDYQFGFEKGRIASDNDYPRIYFNGPITLAPYTTLSGNPKGGSFIQLEAANYTERTK